ncbi:Asp/Glu racemase [Mesorhizobium sp. M1423]|uniref:maleate cis-trans isomerase family protein n=1 Tax=Mesorhizobium sp. M1423 TaxID=2957101 RepID=UPI003335AFDE
MKSIRGLSVAHVAPSYDDELENQTVIGLITLSTDFVTELELRRMLKDDSVSISSTRIKSHNPVTVENLRGHTSEIGKVGQLFDPPHWVHVFAYGCTSGSAVISQAKLEEELHRTIPGSKLTSPMTGALRAFTKLGVERVSLLTPYPDEVNAVLIRCLHNAGITVSACASFHIHSDIDIANVAPASVVEAACATDTREGQALFIPCTGLRTSAIIELLETRLKKPVITAHQAMLWDALRLAGYTKLISGLGRLFTV